MKQNTRKKHTRNKNKTKGGSDSDDADRYARRAAREEVIEAAAKAEAIKAVAEAKAIEAAAEADEKKAFLTELCDMLRKSTEKNDTTTELIKNCDEMGFEDPILVVGGDKNDPELQKTIDELVKLKNENKSTNKTEIDRLTKKLHLSNSWADYITSLPSAFFKYIIDNNEPNDAATMTANKSPTVTIQPEIFADYDINSKKTVVYDYIIHNYTDGSPYSSHDQVKYFLNNYLGYINDSHVKGKDGVIPTKTDRFKSYKPNGVNIKVNKRTEGGRNTHKNRRKLRNKRRTTNKKKHNK